MVVLDDAVNSSVLVTVSLLPPRRHLSDHVVCNISICRTLLHLQGGDEVVDGGVRVSKDDGEPLVQRLHEVVRSVHVEVVCVPGEWRELGSSGTRSSGKSLDPSSLEISEEFVDIQVVRYLVKDSEEGVFFYRTLILLRLSNSHMATM